MNIKTYFLIITTLSALVSGCDNADQVSGNEGSGQQENTDQAVSGVEDKIPALAYIEHNERYNAEAVIPPQCYTKTDEIFFTSRFDETLALCFYIKNI